MMVAGEWLCDMWAEAGSVEVQPTEAQQAIAEKKQLRLVEGNNWRTEPHAIATRGALVGQHALAASMQVTGRTLHLSLKTLDRNIAVQAHLTESEAQALGWWHAYQSGHHESGADDGSRSSRSDIVQAAGEALEAVVVDVSGDEPVFRLRAGGTLCGQEIVVTPVDAVTLLSVSQPPVEVVTPCPSQDWDAALARLLAGNS